MFFKFLRAEHLYRASLLQALPPPISLLLYGVGRKWFFKGLKQVRFSEQNTNFPVQEFYGLKFRNTLGNAAGFDKNGDLLAFNYSIGAGYAIVGTTMHKSYKGNRFSYMGCKFNPWIPLPQSLSAINSLGLPNEGIDKVLSNIKRFRNSVAIKDFPIGLSLTGHPEETDEQKIEGILRCIDKSIQMVDFFEINESCPNVKKNNDIALFANRIERITKHLQNRKPCFIKLNCYSTNSDTLAILQDNRVSGVTITNTLTDYNALSVSVHPKEKKLFDYYTRKYKGGVSGKLIAQNAVETLNFVNKFTNDSKAQMGINFCGGIFNRNDLQQVQPLSNLQQWYTGLLENLATQHPPTIYSNLFDTEVSE